MAGVTLTRRRTSGVDRFRNNHFSVEVVDFEARTLLAALEYATSGPQLAEWMRFQASPLMSESIIDRFAGGGRPGETWRPLTEATIRIKEALGVQDARDPNLRSEELVTAMVEDHLVVPDSLGSTMVIPGDVDDEVLAKKILTAERGDVQGPDDMIPGAVTPPRPVIWVAPVEATMLLSSLQVHIMSTIAGHFGVI